MNLAEAAVKYAEMGWHVFPCKPGGKEPVTLHGVNDATNDVATVRGWWRGRPDANIGLACGPSGLVVIDADGAPGRESWRQLQAEHGSAGPSAYSVTPGGGWHLLFKRPEGLKVRNSAGQMGPKLDVRAKGGYIIVPPSIHPNGGVYRWGGGSAPWERAVAEMPGWLAELLGQEPGRRARASVREAGTVPPALSETRALRNTFRNRRYGLLVAHRLCEELRRTPEGQRNDTLNRAAYQMGRLLGACQLDEADAYEPLAQAAEDVGLDEREIRSTLRSGLEAGRRDAEMGDEHPSGAPKPDGRDATPDGRDAANDPSGKVDGDPSGVSSLDDASPDPLADLPRILAYPMTDAGNGELLAALYGERLRYICGENTWLLWNGARWQPDAKGEALLCAVETARARQLAAAAVADRDRARELDKFGRRSEGGSALREALNCAQRMPPLPVQRRELDADPWLLGCPNGTLDLRTLALRAPRPEDLITRQVAVPYDPEAQAPRWTQFLQEITCGNGALVHFLALAAGYSLTGDTREQVFFMCIGDGANGKSTFLNALRLALGDYAGHAASSCFEMREFGESATNDLAMLNGLRFVTAGETSQGRRLHEQRVKEITGGDPLTVRRLYMEHTTFTPGLKLWMATNHRPEIRGTDAGIWRRVRVIPFRANFAGREDRELEQALRAELPGILAWAVRGCRMWQADGLPLPEVVAEATDIYRCETDPLGRFLRECVREERGGRVGASLLYDRYLQWCRGEGDGPVLSRTKFGMELVRRGLEKGHDRQANFYLDVALVESGS